MSLGFAQSCIAQIPDYPIPGVVFKDVTPIAANSVALLTVLDAIAGHYESASITQIAGIEARGFIFGAALAAHIGVGFVPIRKSGKLPRETHRREYQLEYGVDAIEIHTDAVSTGDRVLVIDDVLATGGTACAALSLIQQCDATAVGIAVLLNLEFLGGSVKVAKEFPSCDVFTVFPDA
jgi:adenine phosphoribosyltransferase